MPGTAHHETHQEPADRRLPVMWRWWGTSIVVLALYLLCLVLHWTHQISHIPTGVSALVHTIVIVLFVGGCVAPIFEFLREQTAARAEARAREAQECPDADLQSQVADLQRWRREVDSPNVVGLAALRNLKTIDERLHGDER